MIIHDGRFDLWDAPVGSQGSAYITKLPRTYIFINLDFQSSFLCVLHIESN